MSDSKTPKQLNDEAKQKFWGQLSNIITEYQTTTGFNVAKVSWEPQYSGQEVNPCYFKLKVDV